MELVSKTSGGKTPVGSNPTLSAKNNMVAVAQLVDRLTVTQEVAGSSPVSHPIFLRRELWE